MRKMIPDGSGGRLHFSVPDFEWKLWRMVCRSNGVDPVEALRRELVSGFCVDSRDLRAVIRCDIERAVFEATALASNANNYQA